MCCYDSTDLKKKQKTKHKKKSRNLFVRDSVSKSANTYDCSETTSDDHTQISFLCVWNLIGLSLVQVL